MGHGSSKCESGWLFLIDHLDCGVELPLRSDNRSIKISIKYQLIMFLQELAYLTINNINQRHIIFVDTRYGSNYR